MENQENKSNWDDLARELGASVPPDAAPPERPAASKPPASADAQRSARGKATPAGPAARPKPTAKDWDSLATDLGLQPPAAPRVNDPTTETKATRMSSDDTPSQSSRPDAPEERPAPTKPAITGRKPSADVAAETPPPATGGGVSLWHKIFGSPEQQAERIVEVARPADADRDHEDSRRREDRPTKPGGRPPDERLGPSAEEGVDDATQWRDSATESSREGAEEGREQRPPEEGDPSRRRGRRRRRGRGRKVEGGAAADVDRASRGEPRAPRQRPARPAPRPHDIADSEIEFDDDDDDDFESLGADLDDDGGSDSDAEDETATGEAARGVSPRHRSIPSWEEAIGLIVDVNMHSRSERRRTSPQKSGRSGPSRGRSRGRRKKT